MRSVPAATDFNLITLEGLLEARAHLAAAEGDVEEAGVMRRRAATLYGSHPVDAARCAV